MNAVVKIQENNGIQPIGAAELVRNPSMMDQFNALASVMAGSKVTIPKHLQGSTSDCFAIVLQAAQWGMSPFSVAQKTHLVNGVLGYEAQLVNAVIQASGAITGRFHYEYTGEGENLACRVGAIIRDESEVVWNEWLTARSVATKNSPLWKTNPKQQLAYLQVKNWARLYCPGAILGVYSEDELPDEKIINQAGSIESNTVIDIKPEPRTCSDEYFKKNQSKWRDPIISGTKNAQDVIDYVAAKGFVFSEEQLLEIDSWTHEND